MMSGKVQGAGLVPTSLWGQLVLLFGYCNQNVKLVDAEDDDGGFWGARQE